MKMIFNIQKNNLYIIFFYILIGINLKVASKIIPANPIPPETAQKDLSEGNKIFV